MSNNPDAATQLDSAIHADLSGEIDFEGRSPVDSLIAEIQNSPKTRGHFIAAANDLASSGRNNQSGWWVVFEHIVSLADLKSSALGNSLERIIVEDSLITGDDRASIYTILDDCDKPQPAYLIKNDQTLFTTAPVRWLDLLMLRIPVLEDGQKLVLSAIERRQFGFKEFSQRLEEMRALGGTKLGNWLREVRAALPEDDIEPYDRLVETAFGLGNLAAGSQPELVDDAEMQVLLDNLIVRIGQVISKGDFVAAGRRVDRSRSVSERGRRGALWPSSPKREGDREAALNIQRIQQTKQLAGMS